MTRPRFFKVFDCMDALRKSDLTSRQLQRTANVSRTFANNILSLLHSRNLIRPAGFGEIDRAEPRGGQKPILWHWTGGVE